MLKSNSKISTFRMKGVRIFFAAFLICLTTSSSLAWGESSDWVKWLLDLLLADAVPQRPILTEEDRGAIDKINVLLQNYPSGADKFMLLGILAAAKGDANEAQGHFVQAAEQGQFRSLLPLTMAAQTHLQENNVQLAVELHMDVLERIQQRPQTPQIQAINAHLDLAVAYSKLEDSQMANEQMELATNLLQTRPLSPTEKGLVYLQLGTVQKEVFRNDQAAVDAWRVGSLTAAASPRLALELNLKVAENIVNTDPKAASQSLRTAEGIISGLSGESKIAAQVKVGEQYTRLATLAIRKKRPDAQRLSARANRLLKPAMDVKDDASAQMILYKTAALEAARSLASERGEEAEKKKYDKKISTVRNKLSLKIVPQKELKILIPREKLKPRIQ